MPIMIVKPGVWDFSDFMQRLPERKGVDPNLVRLVSGEPLPYRGLMSYPPKHAEIVQFAPRLSCVRIVVEHSLDQGVRIAIKDGKRMVSVREAMPHRDPVLYETMGFVDGRTIAEMYGCRGSVF